ncbi:golgin subfamily A member 3 isoform X1 [Ixodes scapularis]
MAYLELNVEQVNKSAELLSYNDHDIDSLSNVVDPRLDISSTSSKKFLAESEQSRRESLASLGEVVPRPQYLPPSLLEPKEAPAPPPPDDAVYPDISALVAEYVAAEDPALCSRVAQTIEDHSRVHSPRKGAPAKAAATVPRSPLKCMSQAADILSVQQSTIGLPLKVAPPNEAVYQELVEYPSESVVASVDQRTSWLRTILTSSAANANHAPPSETAAKAGPRNGPVTAGRKELPSVHYWRRPSEDVGGACLPPDLDNLDSASVCSETESNLSWASEADEEIRLIKNMLAPRRGDRPATMPERLLSSEATQTDPLSTRGLPTKNACVETDATELPTLLREKAHLEGELETLEGELGRLVQTRSELKSRAAEAEARCRQLVREKEASLEREAALSQELQGLRAEALRYGRVVGDYGSLVTSRDAEAGSLHDRAEALAVENKELRTALEELKVDLESRCGAVEGLKKKIAELHVESQSHVRARAQLDSENASLRSELSVVEKAKEWFREQLHESQQGRNLLHRERVSVEAAKMAAESACEGLKAENARLAQELSESRQRSLRDKEGLMRRLEDIEADLLEREAALSREASSAVSGPRKSESNDLSGKLRLAEAEERLQSAESTLAAREVALAALEKDRTSLATDVQRLRLALSESELGRRNQEELLREGAQKVRRLQGELSAGREEAAELRTQRTALEVALAAANEDKRVVGEALGALTENLHKLEANFKLMRTDQVAKAAQLSQLEREKHSLEERLSEAQRELSLSCQQFDSQATSRSQAWGVEANDLRRQKADLERVVQMLEGELKQASARAREAADERSLVEERLKRSEERCERGEAEAEALSQQNASLQSRLSELERRLSEEKARQSAQDSRKEEQASWETRVRELEQTLANWELSSREQERMYKSNIRLLTRKLREKMKELKLMQLQQSQHRVDGAEEDGNEPSTAAAETPASPDGTAVAEEAVGRASAEVASAERGAENGDAQEERQHLLLQLEKEQGKLAGSLRAQEELRNCVEQLERQLAEQVAASTELQCRLEELQEQTARSEARHSSESSDVRRELAKEQALSKDLRQKIFEEKRLSGQLRRQLSTLKEGLTSASQSADARRTECQALLERNQALEQELSETQGRLEGLRGDLKAAQGARQELEARLRGSQERDPALEQQMKLLSWNVKEKSQEVAALKEHARLAEATHQTELGGLRKQLEGSQHQLAGLSSELMAVRKDKFTLQAKVQELKNVLRSRVDQCKELQKQLMEVAETTEFVLPIPPADYDDSYIADLLQQCSALPTSRPLGTLQVCLDSLKQELSTLHSQIKQNVELPKTELVN